MAWALLLAATVGAALLAVHTSGPSVDGPYFTAAGRSLLSGSGLHAYAARGLQAGPWQVAGFGLLSRLTDLVRLPDDATFAVLSSLASTAAVIAGVRWLRRRCGLSASPVAELLAGVLAIGWQLATSVYTSGHVAELVIPIVWVAGAGIARDDRVLVAGLLIGLAAGFETWAVLGAPVLLLAPTWAARAKAVAALMAVTAATYLPFVLAGPFRMGDATWAVSRHSLIHAIDPNLATFPWTARLVQSVVVVGVGVFGWLLLRHRCGPTAVWVIPALIAMSKAISEPSGYDWYWLPAQLTLLAGCACLDGLPRRLALAVVVGEVVAVTSPLHAWPIAALSLAGLLAATANRSPNCHFPTLSSANSV